MEDVVGPHIMKLKFHNVGTNEIEHHLAGKYWWSEFWIAKERKCLLNIRIAQASAEMSRLKYIFDKQLEYLRRRWGHNRGIFSCFNNIMQQEVNFVWAAGVERNKRKISHLSSKWCPPSSPATDNTTSLVNGAWNDILISDEALRAKYGEHQPTIAVYGGVKLTENERKVL